MAKRRRPAPNPAGPSRNRANADPRPSPAQLADPAWGDNERGVAALSHDENLDIAPPSIRRGQTGRPRRATGRPRPSSKRGPAAAIPEAHRAPSNVETIAETDLPKPPGSPGTIGLLTCVAGSEKGQHIDLREGIYGVGRGRDNHFVLKDIACSRQHIELRVQGGEVTLHDLGSGNGTRLNGTRIQSATLRAGDRIEIGNSTLTYKPMAGARQQSSVVSVPPNPIPKPADLWPETESLLAELEEYEQAARQPRKQIAASTDVISARQRDPRLSQTGQPQAVAANLQAMQAGQQGAMPGQSLSEIRAAIGASGGVSSTTWFIGGAILILVLLAGLALLVFNAQIKNSASEEAAGLLMRGHQALALTQYDQAHQFFTQAQGLTPDSPEVNSALDLLARHQQSSKAYARALELLKKEDFDEARHALEGVVAGTPRAVDVPDTRRRIDRAEANALVRQAQQYFDKKSLDQAEQLAEKARIVLPEHAGAQSMIQKIHAARKSLTPVNPVTTPQDPANAQTQAPAPQPQAQPKPQVKRPQPKPRPKKVRRPHPRTRRRAKLSDGDAKNLYKDALRAYKNGNKSKSKALLKRILRGTKAGNLYHEKAQSFIVRKL